MTGQITGQALGSSLTPMVLQIMVALFFVAAVVALGVVILYSVITGALLWVLVLIVGCIRLLVRVLRGAWAMLQGYLAPKRPQGPPRIAPGTGA